jgi:hypothetical protein
LCTFSKCVESSGLIRGSLAFYRDHPYYPAQGILPGLGGVIFNNFPHTRAFMHALVKQVSLLTRPSTLHTLHT